jgi:sugar phosphate isomerase/epimerase
MNVAIASYAFHGLLREGVIDLFGYLESCRYRYDLRTADIWNGMLASTDDDYLAKVKRALAERELALVNLCVDGPHLWEDDRAKREEHERSALRYLEVAETLGAKTLRIDAGGRDDQWTSEQLDYIVSRYQEYARLAHERGFKVGPENHWGAEVLPQNMKQLCEAVDHPAFGVLLHFRGNEGDALMAPWAMHTHITFDLAQHGLEESMQMLRAAGYQGCWSVEHHSGTNEYSEVAIQLAKVRDVLARWELDGV